MENKKIKEEMEKTEALDEKEHQKKETGIAEKTADESSKKEEKNKEPEKKQKKDEARVNAKNLQISTKHSVAICRFIRGKKINKAEKELEKVLLKKLAIPMKGEIPHRKGIGGGRYPIKASKVFIKLLKSLDANSGVNGVENPYISLAKADKASRPHRRSGKGRFKRTNVLLISRGKKQIKNAKNTKK